MAEKVYLFTSGNVSYGVIARSEWLARAFMRQTHRGMNLEFAGEDMRSWIEQSKSNTIGVVVPADWKPQRVPKNMLEHEFLGEYVKFSVLGRVVTGRVLAGSDKNKSLTVEFWDDGAQIHVTSSYWHFERVEEW